MDPIKWIVTTRGAELVPGLREFRRRVIEDCVRAWGVSMSIALVLWVLARILTPPARWPFGIMLATTAAFPAIFVVYALIVSVIYPRLEEVRSKRGVSRRGLKLDGELLPWRKICAWDFAPTVDEGRYPTKLVYQRGFVLRELQLPEGSKADDVVAWFQKGSEHRPGLEPPEPPPWAVFPDLLYIVLIGGGIVSGLLFGTLPAGTHKIALLSLVAVGPGTMWALLSSRTRTDRLNPTLWLCVLCLNYLSLIVAAVVTSMMFIALRFPSS